jgi:hypothetical protein
MNTLNELERLLRAGTPGPWKLIENFRDAFSHDAGHYTVTDGTAFLDNQGSDAGEFSFENAALIVAAINALPGLIESARRVERLEAALKPFAQMADAVDGAKEVEVQITDVDSGESITLVMGTSRFLNARTALKGT